MHIRRVARLISLAALVGSGTGCETVEAPMDATVLEASAKGYVIEVKTIPGLLVETSSVSVKADAAGIARLTVPLANVAYLTTFDKVSVRVSGRSGLKSYSAEQQVRPPKATIVLGSKSTATDGFGKGKVSFTPDEVLALVPSAR